VTRRTEKRIPPCILFLTNQLDEVVGCLARALLKSCSKEQTAVMKISTLVIE
jgi:hypothetical protein